MNLSPEQAALAALWAAYNAGCLGVIGWLTRRLSRCEAHEEERIETTRKLADSLQKQVDAFEARDRLGDKK